MTQEKGKFPFVILRLCLHPIVFFILASAFAIETDCVHSVKQSLPFSDQKGVCSSATRVRSALQIQKNGLRQSSL